MNVLHSVLCYTIVIAKKKREYGIVWQGNADLKPYLEQDVTVWDMHAHLDMCVCYEEDVVKEIHNKLIEHPEQKIPEVKVPSVAKIAHNSVESGVNGIVHCGCDMENILNISAVLDEIELATHKVVGAIAIHPNESVLHYAAHNAHYLPEPAPDGLNPPKLRDVHYKYSLEDCIAKFEGLIKNDNRIKIIGETGLDYFRTTGEGIKIQKQSLKMHIELAKTLNLPVQIHDRDAHLDICEILEDQKPERVLFHSFSGDTSLAQRCIDNGWYASFSGPVTFNANNELRDAFWLLYNKAPELLLFETDSPFLTPMPYRGRTCTPAQTANTITFLAKLISEREGCDTTIAIRKLMRIESDNVRGLLSF